jgi:hypothetical protein
VVRFGEQLNAVDPASGKTVRSLDVAAHAGTGLRRQAPVPDRRGPHPEDRSRDRPRARDDPAPGRRRFGLAWAEGSLWVGSTASARSIRSIPRRERLRTIESNRFVTGVTWVDGELWHATWEGDESELRRIDPRTGEVLEELVMPPGANVSGLESDGEQFFCGGGKTGKVRAVRRPKRESKRT